MPQEPTPTPVAAPPPEARRPDPLAESVARAIAGLRSEAGLSERAAARKLGTSQTQLRRMEDPRYLPSLRSLQRVASVYGRTVKVTFESPGEEAAPPKPPAPRRPERPARTAPPRRARPPLRRGAGKRATRRPAKRR